MPKNRIVLKENFLILLKRKPRFTESQIIAILEKDETGTLVADLLRTHGSSRPTYDNWKPKYGDLEV